MNRLLNRLRFLVGIALLYIPVLTCAAVTGAICAWGGDLATARWLLPDGLIGYSATAMTSPGSRLRYTGVQVTAERQPALMAVLDSVASRQVSATSMECGCRPRQTRKLYSAAGTGSGASTSASTREHDLSIEQHADAVSVQMCGAEIAQRAQHRVAKPECHQRHRHDGPSSSRCGRRGPHRQACSSSTSRFGRIWRATSPSRSATMNAD
jgi:hypothetical protein